MPARKSRPVLYEVIRRGERPQENAAPRPAPSPCPPASGPVQILTPAPPSTAPAGPRTLRLADGRASITLGWGGGAVLAVALLLLLVVTFQAGVRYARQSQRTGPVAQEPSTAADREGDLEALLPAGPRRTDARDELAGQRPTGLEGTQRPPAAETPPRSVPPVEPTPPAQATFEKGRHYVVVQHFRRTEMEAAQAAAAFLRSNGILCTIVRGRDLQLVAHESFLLNQKDAAARTRERERCDALKQRIKALGKEYARGAGYAFDQCYDREWAQ